mmetsp:Transcript_84843/g.235267  ORF Transcript_84843/g.235267 Transcript_84843/m.235267 type:complete len:214 (+) Transcript_84843:1209-1850(+)
MQRFSCPWPEVAAVQPWLPLPLPLALRCPRSSTVQLHHPRHPRAAGALGARVPSIRHGVPRHMLDSEELVAAPIARRMVRQGFRGRSRLLHSGAGYQYVQRPPSLVLLMLAKVVLRSSCPGLLWCPYLSQAVSNILRGELPDPQAPMTGLQSYLPLQTWRSRAGAAGQAGVTVRPLRAGETCLSTSQAFLCARTASTAVHCEATLLELKVCIF